MGKIKGLSPWEIIDLWETDAGTMDFADTDYLDQLRFRVHLYDAHTGFDHTSTAYVDGAFFFQMPRAEYKDWARKAVHDPQYAKTGLKGMEAVRGRLDIQGVRFDDLGDVSSAWQSAQNDSDIFPGVGATPGMFEVISHG